MGDLTDMLKGYGKTTLVVSGVIFGLITASIIGCGDSSAKNQEKQNSSQQASSGSNTVPQPKDIKPLKKVSGGIEAHISQIESQYLKHNPEFLDEYISGIEGDITKISISEGKSEFSGSTLEIYVAGKDKPIRYSGMDVSGMMIRSELEDMKRNVERGISYNAQYNAQQVATIRSKIFNYLDIIDGKVPGKTMSFTPSLTRQLGFKRRSDLKKVLNGCTGITIRYDPRPNSEDLAITYKTPNGDHIRRLSEIAAEDIFK